MTQAGRVLPMLPVLDVAPPPETAARKAADADDARLGEFRPESRALPSFYVWTLGCQMNRSDSEEMAGRLLAAGCAEAHSMETADLVVINTCAIREAAEAKVIGRQGELAKLKARNASMRVVMTGCAVREMDHDRLDKRFPAVDLFLRPDQEPELVDRLGLASAQGPVGLGVAMGAAGATTIVGRTAVGVADHLARTRAAAVAGGAVHRSSAVSAWLPIIYGCDKTCTYCIVPFSRGPERSRPFDEIVDEARSIAAGGFREVTLLGQNVNSYGHDLAPEARFGHVATERWAGRQLDLGSRPDLAELIRTIDGLRTADGNPAIPRLRFITSHPWDLSDRLIEAMAECSSLCESLHLPVQSGDDAMLRRMGRQYTIEHYLERLDRIRDAVPDIAISTDVIVGFCGETEGQFESTLRLLERVRYDQVFAAAYSERPGTPATRMPDDVPADDKRRRLN
ncbi:MAG: MiaB/RimO family radical SAM methylthiotransferase, partial [Chloroflexota bacterium]